MSENELTLRQILDYFIEHRHEVVVRRSEFDLAKAKAHREVREDMEKLGEVAVHQAQQDAEDTLAGGLVHIAQISSREMQNLEQARATSSTGTSGSRPAPSAPARRASSTSAARRPSRRRSWRTVVRAGER